MASYARCVKIGASHISIAQLTSVPSSSGLRDMAGLWRPHTHEGRTRPERLHRDTEVSGDGLGLGLGRLQRARRQRTTHKSTDLGRPKPGRLTNVGLTLCYEG
jgi:hypothetical protein